MTKGLEAFDFETRAFLERAARNPPKPRAKHKPRNPEIAKACYLAAEADRIALGRIECRRKFFCDRYGISINQFFRAQSLVRGGPRAKGLKRTPSPSGL